MYYPEMCGNSIYCSHSFPFPRLHSHSLTHSHLFCQSLHGPQRAGNSTYVGIRFKFIRLKKSKGQEFWSYWSLPVSQRIALMTNYFIHVRSSAYFSDVCVPVVSVPFRSWLRSADNDDMIVSRTRTVRYGPRSFVWWQWPDLEH